MSNTTNKGKLPSTDEIRKYNSGPKVRPSPRNFSILLLCHGETLRNWNESLQLLHSTFHCDMQNKKAISRIRHPTFSDSAVGI